MSETHFTHETKPVIALINADDHLQQLFSGGYFERYQCIRFANGMEFFHYREKSPAPLALIVSRSEIMASSGVSLHQAFKEKNLPQVPFIIITHYLNDNLQKIALRAGISDIFPPTVQQAALERRVDFLVNNWQTISQEADDNKSDVYQTPMAKRIFDIVISLGALMVLSPIFLIIIVALKIESRGPAFYFSYRVGTGYRIFKLYKFRSMHVNAEEQVKSLKHLNQYGRSIPDKALPISAGRCSECAERGIECRLPLYADTSAWCEKQYFEYKRVAPQAAFFKLADDPRISTVGRILRKTSLDELPQLLNVLKGEMSIVGNRPLPLYEAERLTTDKHALRFMAPAGITGLWQVKNRGRIMSEEERLKLDNSYAQDNSFLKDLWLILMTIPAMFQSENS